MILTNHNIFTNHLITHIALPYIAFHMLSENLVEIVIISKYIWRRKNLYNPHFPKLRIMYTCFLYCIKAAIAISFKKKTMVLCAVMKVVQDFHIF